MKLLSILLKHMIKQGTLVVIDGHGRRYVFAASQSPSVTVHLHNRTVGHKLALNPHLSLGEAYMDGSLTVEDGDIYNLLDLLTLNIGWQHGTRLFNIIARSQRLFTWLAHYNPVSRSHRNVAHHYDLSDQLYELFLDEGRQYSCGYFDSPADDLEKAQKRKKTHLAAKLCSRPGHRILDIGCGWGGLAIDLARMLDTDVTGITLSELQFEYAQNSVAKQGLSQKVKFALQDYRTVRETYDRIVSVGMFEHVGIPHYRDFFRILYNTLADDGVALLHTIGRAEGPAATNAWIKKYIFPGGYIPALSEIMPAIERAGFYITDIEILRLHYAETLRAWRQRFAINREKILDLYDERFCRMWEFYLAVSEVAFRNCGQVVFQVQLAKRQDAVPLTRNYIFESERHGEDEDRHVLAA